MQTSKIIPLLILTSLIMVSFSCQKDDKSRELEEITITQNQFIKENVSFVDARIRNVSESEYVREVVLNNHSPIKMMPVSLIFQDTYFVDDGSFNDLNSNDGVYTSTNRLEYLGDIKYDKHNPTVSLMTEVIFDKTFKYKNQVKNLSVFKINSNLNGKYYKDGNGGVNKVSIIQVECDIAFGTSGCRAERWGWCSSCCFTISNCSKITIGW